MQKIYIVKFNLLYEILEEIKENFSFKIIKVENERDFLEYNDLDKENFLIISKNNSKLLKDIKGLNKNFLNFDHLPLTLKKIFEIINIKLIQLKFNHQSKIIIKDYELNLNSKFITRDNLSLKLTEKEAEIILYLNHNRIKHDVTDLQKNIWGYATNIETHTVETHIYRLRKKISNLFKDDNFILSDKNGYFIS
jgi:DNA-binding response OmpR family regulator